jgi:hypothetical protein
MTQDDLAADPNLATGALKDQGANGAGGTGKSATPETDDWFANSEYAKFGTTPQEAMANMAGRLSNVEIARGRLADDLGETRRQVIDTEAIKKTKRESALRLKEALNSDDPEILESGFDVIAKMLFDFQDMQESTEVERVKAHDLIVERHPELADVRYGEVIKEARRRGIPISKLADQRDMKRFMSEIKASRLGKRDIDAEIKKAREEGIKEGQKLATAKGSVIAGGGTGSGGGGEQVTDDPMERINTFAQRGGSAKR